MEKINIIATSPTGSGKYPGILCLATGIIEYKTPGECVEYSHITSELQTGWEINGVVPEPKAKEEPVKPKTEEVPLDSITAPRSKRFGPSKSKG